MVEWLAGALGTKKAVMIAGLIGAIISLRFVSEVTSWRSRVTMVVCGFFGASYGTPALAEWMKVSERVESGLAFAIGLLFMSLAGAIVGAIKDAKLSEAISTWFKKPGA